MTDIYGFKNDHRVIWFHKLKKKSNRYCLYSGIDVGSESNIESDKEHLIERNFVPTGTFSEGKKFNFFFRACKNCNTEKCEYERHISSVTLINSPARADDSQTNALALYKASKDFHPSKPGVLVKDAYENHEISFAPFSFEMISPPQLSLSYVKALSFRHAQGLFTLLTSKNPLNLEGTRLLPPDNFIFFGCFAHGDWGNPQLLEIIRRSEKWNCYANLVTADGYFKAIMRRDDATDTGWFWALEWNKSVRVCGAIGAPSTEPLLFSNLPDLEWGIWEPNGNIVTRSRREIPLINIEDTLFNDHVVSG